MITALTDDEVLALLTEEERKTWHHEIYKFDHAKHREVPALLRTIAIERMARRDADGALRLILSWAQNRDRTIFDRDAIESLCLVELSKNGGRP